MYYALSNDFSGDDRAIVIAVAEDVGSLIDQLAPYAVSAVVTPEEQAALYAAVRGAKAPNDGMLGALVTDKVPVGAWDDGDIFHVWLQCDGTEEEFKCHTPPSTWRPEIKTWGVREALEDLVERCDGEEGVRADGTNIYTLAAHAALGHLAQDENVQAPPLSKLGLSDIRTALANNGTPDADKEIKAVGYITTQHGESRSVAKYMVAYVSANSDEPEAGYVWVEWQPSEQCYKASW